MTVGNSFIPMGQIVGSKPARAGWVLLKLKEIASFTCGECGVAKASRNVAVAAAGGETLYCNGCYGRHVARGADASDSAPAPASVSAFAPQPQPTAALTGAGTPADAAPSGTDEAEPVVIRQEEPGEPVDVSVTESQVQWSFVLRKRHMDTGWCPLPPAAVTRLVQAGQKTREKRSADRAAAHAWTPRTMTVRGGAGFPVSLVDGPLAVTGADSLRGVRSVRWDRSDLTIGTRILARLDRHQLRLFVTPLTPRVVVAGHVVNYEYDLRVVARELPEKRVEVPGRSSAGADTLVLETIRKLGYLDEKGRALLPLDSLTRNLPSDPGRKLSATTVRKAVNRLVHAKRLRWETGSRGAAGGLLNFPARAGEPTVSLVCYTPFPELVPGEVNHRLTHLPGGLSRHEVSGHLMKIDGQAGEEARAAYAESHRAAGLTGSHKLPKGYTYRRPHARGE
ncbi:hypothetical protein ACH4JZ_08720 [Streptomyces sp. NPDC017615]|uniref:hypothetical protein n=1 Tax=Streptomyces sp. NPDC017615 TaxID=3365003 RepID=UPI0037A52E2B